MYVFEMRDEDDDDDDKAETERNYAVDYIFREKMARTGRKTEEKKAKKNQNELWQ